MAYVNSANWVPVSVEAMQTAQDSNAVAVVLTPSRELRAGFVVAVDIRRKIASLRMSPHFDDIEIDLRNRYMRMMAVSPPEADDLFRLGQPSLNL